MTSETARYPTEIGTVRAVDMDSGEWGRIQYTLSGPGSEKFYLDKIAVSTMRK